jgi:CRISPR/Cas system CSM-associated protein Csm4 (group 5 of RAMP superfamily)
MPGLLVRLRPEGAWRIGPDSGARGRAECVLSSDALYSAITQALGALGWMEPWLEATAAAEGEPAVRLSSLFPAQEENLLAPPPAHLWPAPAARLRTGGARLVPTSLIRALALGEEWNEDQWEVDGLSECLLRRGRRRPAGSPYRFALRRGAAVDRLEPGRIALHERACIEFAEGAGLWCVVQFAGEAAQETWAPRIEAAFRLLADSGLGGGRRQGWGRFTLERVDSGEFPELVWGRGRSASPSDEPATPAEERGWWLLSLFSPAESDRIDWTRGSFGIVERGGRIDGAGHAKLHSRMVREGSLLLGERPRGRAWNVAPPEFTTHPVWRSGFALAIELPWRVPA